MQSEEDKKRIINIGANPDKVKIMGNLKFDIVNKLNHEDIYNLKKSLELENEKVLIAGSTHYGEDEIILSVYQRLKEKFQDLKLVIAPRHPERYAQVIKLLSQSDFKYGLRSKNANFKESEVILLDTMGELGNFYSVTHLAFIGGSFSGTGGHNPLEAAIYGIPVVSGPTVFNFKDIYSYMTSNGAAKIINNEEELYSHLRELLKNSDKYNKASQAAENIFESNKGALDYALSKIKSFIKY